MTIKGCSGEARTHTDPQLLGNFQAEQKEAEGRELYTLQEAETAEHRLSGQWKPAS